MGLKESFLPWEFPQNPVLISLIGPVHDDVSNATGDLSATDVSDDEGERDDVYQERNRSYSEGTEAERSERTEEEFFENNASTSSSTSYSDNESVKSNLDEEDPFKWEKVHITCRKFNLFLLHLTLFSG